MSSSVLALYHRITRWPFGHWLFSRAVCLKAPYFASIAPRFVMLEPGRCVVRIRHRRRVYNHIGTVHAIALCNMAELSAGVMTDATLPPQMRWIPRGMTVSYLKKAVGPMQAEATAPSPPEVTVEGYAWSVPVRITDQVGDAVCEARIDMWLSPRKLSPRKKA